MADARQVLDATIREALLLAQTGGTVDQITPLLELARGAFDAGDGEITDSVVRNSGIHPAVQSRLGIS